MKVTLKIPNGYQDITIAEYHEVQRIQKKHQTAELSALEIVSYLCEVSPKVMRKVGHDDLMDVIDKMRWLFEPLDIDAFKLEPSFTHKGVEYGFIPDLSDLTVAEFADLDSYVRQSAYDNLHKVASVLYRPVTKRLREFYDIEPYEPSKVKQEAANDWPVSIAFGALVFFYDIAKQLLVDMNASSTAKADQTR